jgi:dihydroflavonol-4-reductase
LFLEGTNDGIHVFDEDDWSDLHNPKLTHYVRSKTLAEKAAWDFVKNINGQP